MRRMMVAVAAAALVIVGVGVADHAVSGPESLPAPPDGEMTAATLADGAPVYVAREGDGGVDVISAVSTHMLRLVYWCEREDRFVEPMGATFFDRRGRYGNGPAPTGLAHYDAELSEDAETVLVGDLGEPQHRAERPDPPLPSRVGDCVGTEGALGGTAPTLPAEELDPADVGGMVGERAVVKGRLHVDEDGMRLCDHGRDACGPEALAVSETWWPGQFDDHEGWLDGRFLVLVSGHGRVTELAKARRPTDGPDIFASGLRYVDERPEIVHTQGTILAFDLDAGTVTLRDVEPLPGESEGPLPSPGADGTVTLPLDDEPWLQRVRDGRILNVYPEELEQVVAASAPEPAEVAITEHGEVRGLSVGDFE